MRNRAEMPSRTEIQSPTQILAELERQRDLYRSHLEWIERTILAAKGVEPPSMSESATADKAAPDVADRGKVAGATSGTRLPDRIGEVLRGRSLRIGGILDALGEVGVSATTQEIEAALSRYPNRFERASRGWWKLIEHGGRRRTEEP